MYHFVYKITNLVNSKFYIGVHSTDELNDGYLGSGVAIKMAVEKYGKHNFKREILEFFDTRELALLREGELVTEELVLHEGCYNIVVGGGVWVDGNKGKQKGVKNKVPSAQYLIDNYTRLQEIFDGLRATQKIDMILKIYSMVMPRPRKAKFSDNSAHA